MGSEQFTRFGPVYAEWPIIRLRDVLTERVDWIELSDDVDYQRVTARVRNQGIEPRDRLSGAQIKTKRQKRCRTGDLLVAEIDAKVGGFGIVPADCDNAIVSGHYFLFEIDAARVDLGWFDKVIRDGRLQRQVDAVGSTNYAAIRARDVEAFQMPLPPLAEQRAIAEVLEAVDAAITATEALIEASKIAREFISLDISIDPAYKPKIISLSEIVNSLDAGVSVNSEKRPKSEGELGILKTSSTSFGIFNPDEHKAIIKSEYTRATTPVRGDCIIVSRMNTPNLVGASAYVDKDYLDLFLPDRLWLLDVSDRRKINVKWLSILLSSKNYRDRLSELATGTSGSMKNLSKKLFLNIKITIPSINQQNYIATTTSILDEKVVKDELYLNNINSFRTALARELLSGRLRLPESLIARHRDPPADAAARPASGEPRG